MNDNRLAQYISGLLNAAPRIHRARPYSVTVRDNNGFTLATRIFLASSKYRAELTGLHSSIFVYKENALDATAIPNGWNVVDLNNNDVFDNNQAT